MQTYAQVLVFLFYATACTMHSSIIRPDPIPEKAIIVLMILTLCLALYITYPNFTLFMPMILRLIKTCKGPIQISKGPLILGYMHVCMCLNGICAVVPFKCIPSFGPGLSLPYKDRAYMNADLNYFYDRMR